MTIFFFFPEKYFGRTEEYLFGQKNYLFAEKIYFKSSKPENPSIFFTKKRNAVCRLQFLRGI